MGEILFSGPAAVYLQSDPATSDGAVEIKGLHDGYAEYTLVGFQDPVVFIRDYRQAGQQALQYVLATEDVSKFADVFNTPAQVEMYRLDDGSILVTLFETKDRGKKFCLWMPIGLEDSLPVYNYIFDEIAAIDDNHFAGLFVFQRHLHEKRERSSQVIKPAPAWNAGRGIWRAACPRLSQ